MARARVRIYPGAVERAIDTPDMRKALHEAGDAIAEAVREQGITVGDENGGPDEVALPVGVFDNQGAKPSAAVVLDHPAGLAVQAKHGALSKAAAEAGLRMTGGSE